MNVKTAVFCIRIDARVCSSWYRRGRKEGGIIPRPLSPPRELACLRSHPV